MWRRSRHLTVRQTARRAGMEPERWRAIEQGELAPAPDQLHQLALGLNLSLADLEELAQCCEPMWGPGQEGASGPAYS